MLRVAITRPVSTSIVDCELTHLSRTPIDYARAVVQHDEYQALLAALGCKIVRVPAAHDMPDAVFVEDTAVVLDEVAIMTRPGAESRRHEPDTVEAVLTHYRRAERMHAPATLDGGDVLRVGRRLFVGRSTRTNNEGISRLREIASGHGYDVTTVDIHGCLHLKSAVTQVGEHTVLGNRDWTDASAFADLEWIDVDPDEPVAGNALWLDSAIIFPRAFTRTAAALRTFAEKNRMSVHLVDASELAKAEGGLTCCSLILSD